MKIYDKSEYEGNIIEDEDIKFTAEKVVVHGNIDALNINARFILCEKRIKKSPNSKTIAYAIVMKRSTAERREVM